MARVESCRHLSKLSKEIKVIGSPIYISFKIRIWSSGFWGFGVLVVVVFVCVACGVWCVACGGGGGV